MYVCNFFSSSLQFSDAPSGPPTAPLVGPHFEKHKFTSQRDLSKSHYCKLYFHEYVSTFCKHGAILEETWVVTVLSWLTLFFFFFSGFIIIAFHLNFFFIKANNLQGQDSFSVAVQQNHSIFETGVTALQSHCGTITCVRSQLGGTVMQSFANCWGCPELFMLTASKGFQVKWETSPDVVSDILKHLERRVLFHLVRTMLQQHNDTCFTSLTAITLHPLYLISRCCDVLKLCLHSQPLLFKQEFN